MLKIDQERFFAKTKLATEVRPGMETPCLEWTARINHKGYGQFRIDGKTEQAHRVAWWFSHGRWPVPCGLHKCDNRRCVREEHLFEGTDADNYADMVAKGRDRKAKGKETGAYTHPESRPRGENNGFAKLTESDIRGIIALRLGGFTLQRIADKFAIHNSHVYRIVTRKVWAHLVIEGEANA